MRYLQRAALLDPAEAPGVGDEVVATAAALLSAARRSAQSAGSHASADAAGVSTPCLDSERGCTGQSYRVTQDMIHAYGAASRCMGTHPVPPVAPYLALGDSAGT